MAETKNAIKKVGEVTPMAIPAKEQAEPLKEIPAVDENYRKIIESAASVGVTIPEGSIDVILLAQALVDKLLRIDENLRPLAQSIEKDERVGELIAALCQGETIEEALLECEIIAQKEQKSDEADFNQSLKEANKFCTHHKLDHSAIECFVQFVQGIVSEVSKGKITQDVLTLFWKSFTFDKEVKEAFSAGVLKGRNMNIEELRSEREQNDGMGSISGGASIEKTLKIPGYIERIIKNKR